MLFLLAACAVCEAPPGPPACSLALRGPVEGAGPDQGGPVLGIFGPQGGIHVEADLSGAALTDRVRIRGRIGEVDSEPAWIDLGRRRLEIVDAERCTTAPLLLFVPFATTREGCAYQGLPVRVEVEVERSDGARTTCEATAPLELDPASIGRCPR